MIRIPSHMLLLCLLIQPVFSQRPPRAAEQVTVIAFISGWQVIDPCQAVTMFRSLDSKVSDDLKDRFSGCSAKGVPYGAYEVRLRSRLYDTTRTKDPVSGHRCEVDQRRSVCLIAVEELELWSEPPLKISLHGLSAEANNSVTLSVASIYRDWLRLVSADSAMEAVVHGPWEDLTITVIVNGTVVGAAYVDRRRRQRAETNLIEHIVLDCDPKRGRVTVMSQE